MSVTVFSTFENALTPKAMLGLWSNAFGIPVPLPDTAAMILAPTDLLSGPVLSSLVLSDLKLDTETYTSAAGAFQVQAADNTGLIVCSFQVSLPITTGTNPVGMALFSQATGDLWYVSAFSAWPNPLPSLFTWNVKITLGTCQGS